MSFVEFKHVSKHYITGNNVIKAADDVNFSIEQGEFCVVVGPSGAGKTTVLNMLGGMDTITEGEIVVERNGKRYSIVYRFVDDNEARPHTIAGSYAGTVEFTNLVRDVGSSPL